MLCVPATSAPTERVFSVAGLTISKCRASVLPQNASDLIFLHDSWLVAEECEAELMFCVMTCSNFLNGLQLFNKYVK